MDFSIPLEWTQKGLIDFLSSRTSEDKWLECKAFLLFDPRLQAFTDSNGNKPFANNPFHSKDRVESFWVFRVIESIIAFANAEGGLLLLGVGENRAGEFENCDGIQIESSKGEQNFIITGVEKDHIGLNNNAVIEDDKYIRTLWEILFPKRQDKYKKRRDF
jgi:hypothetical protein